MNSTHSLPGWRDDLRDSARLIRPLDWLMLALALIAICLVGWAIVARPEGRTLSILFAIDYSLCVLFAGQFVLRWKRSGFSRHWLGRNWYELLGMIPLQPTISGGYWIAVLRVVILLARFGIALNHAFGHEFTHRTLLRIRNAIVGAISGALTIAVLDRVAEVLAQGTYTRNVSRALEDNQNELRVMIAEKLREDQQAGRLSRLPFVNDLIEVLIDTCMRVVEQVLRDPRTDRLVADILRENLSQIRAAVEEEETAAELARQQRQPPRSTP